MDLILFFSIYSFSGWILETVSCSIFARKFINRGFLNGFFCPIYGFGAIIIIQTIECTSYIFKNYNEALGFGIVFSILLVTTLEYVTGFLLDKFFNCRYWDYNNVPLNFNGYICIPYSILWGFLALILIGGIHPVTSRIVLLMPTMLKNYMVVLLMIYFFTDTIISTIDAWKIRKAVMKNLGFISGRLNEKLVRYKRLFSAFYFIIIVYKDELSRNIRSNIYDGIDKIKAEIKGRV
jgi:uncharacterized membrane protein